MKRLISIFLLALPVLALNAEVKEVLLSTIKVTGVSSWWNANTELNALRLVPPMEGAEVSYYDITGDGKIDLADYDLMSIYEQCKDEDLRTEQFSYGTEDFINEFSRANSSAGLGSMDITSFIYELLVDSSDGLVSKAEKGEIDTDINGDGITDLRDLYDLYIYSIKEKGTPDIICSYAHPELSEDDVSRISEKAASFAEYTESTDGLKKLITLYIKKSDIRASDLTPEAYRDIYKISYDDDVLIYEYDVNAQDAAAKYEAEHPDGPDKKYLWHSLESDFVLRVAGVMEDIEETSDTRKIYDNGIIGEVFGTESDMYKLGDNLNDVVEKVTFEEGTKAGLIQSIAAGRSGTVRVVSSKGIRRYISFIMPSA